MRKQLNNKIWLNSEKPGLFENTPVVFLLCWVEQNQTQQLIFAPIKNLISRLDLISFWLASE